MGIFVFLANFLSVSLVTAAIYGFYRFYRRHLIDVELHANSSDSYCFVIDSEREPKGVESRYYAQLKATVSISAGPGLVLEDIRVVVKNFERYSEVEYAVPQAPENVRDHFDHYAKEWDAAGSSEKQSKPGIGATNRLTAMGAAVRRDNPFGNLENGGYEVVLIVVLKRFLIVVPCRFASMRGAEASTICGAAKVCRKVANTFDSIALAKDVEPELRGRDNIFRLQLAILDFDFLPFSSLYKAFRTKRESISSPPTAD